MDLAGLISSFATNVYSVERTAHATPQFGKYPAGATQTITITASVSPASGADLLRLPEGRRSNATVTIYTTTELFVGGKDAGYEADVVTVEGVEWEIQTVARWQDPVTGDFAYACVAQSLA